MNGHIFANVSFQLDISGDYSEFGENMLLAVRQDVWEMIFKNAEMNVLNSLMLTAMSATGDKNRDECFKNILENQLESIKNAALSATYEITEFRSSKKE